MKHRLSILHYPLDWPLGYTRTESPKQARFKTTFAKARAHCEEQATALGGSDLIISTNLELNHAGTAKVSRNNPQDPGVALYFTMDGEEMVLACDAWMHVEDNLRAIGLTLHAMRGIARWSVSEVLSRAFQGFLALPETVGIESTRTWYDVLEISPDATVLIIRAAIRKKSLELHPDKGGDRAKWDELQAAIAETRK